MVFLQASEISWADLGSGINRGKELSPLLEGKSFLARIDWAQRVVMRSVHEFVCVYVCTYTCSCVSLGAGAQSPHTAWWSLQPLPQGIIQAYQSGDIVLDNTTSMGRWELIGSFFFSVSTITTIGKNGVGPGGRGWGGWSPEGQGTSAFWRDS